MFQFLQNCRQTPPSHSIGPKPGMGATRPRPCHACCGGARTRPLQAPPGAAPHPRTSTAGASFPKAAATSALKALSWSWARALVGYISSAQAWQGSRVGSSGGQQCMAAGAMLIRRTWTRCAGRTCNICSMLPAPPPQRGCACGMCIRNAPPAAAAGARICYTATCTAPPPPAPPQPPQGLTSLSSLSACSSGTA